MKIAIKISDDLLRDSSVRQIVDLCMTANDLRTARILFRAIQAGSISEDALNDHPSLGGGVAGAGRFAHAAALWPALLREGGPGSEPLTKVQN